MHLHLEDTDFISYILLSCADELDLISNLDGSVHNLEVCDDSSERVEHRVEDEGLKRSIWISHRSRNSLYDSIENLFHSLTCLTGCKKNLLRLTAKKVHNLISNDINHRRIHINLVEHRNDFKIVFNCKIKIRYCLSLNTLSSINNQNSTLT